jgi:hypothetical protein
MGFLDNLRLVGSIAKGAQATSPRWARIVGVGRKIGPLTTIELEIHNGDEEPFMVSTLQWVPRGVEPRVGRDVAFRISTGDSHTSYQILWDEPPQYGERDAQPLVAGMQRAVEDGRMSQADFERAKERLRQKLGPPR